MHTYSIIRFYENGKKRIIQRGLTLAEAQTHCQKPQTSGIKNGIRWFDGFKRE